MGANYRPEAGKFTPENIDPKLCTHLIYSFAGLDNSTWSIKSLDPWMDFEKNYNGGGLSGFRKTTALKVTHPHLKVTLAIGGWNEGSEMSSSWADSEGYQSSSGSTVLTLRRGDVVGLEVTDGEIYEPGSSSRGYTMFSGYRVG